MAMLNNHRVFPPTYLTELCYSIASEQPDRGSAVVPHQLQADRNYRQYNTHSNTLQKKGELGVQLILSISWIRLLMRNIY